MSWKLSRYRAGDLVEVRSFSEILTTLDRRGRINELPFMPEMQQFCGKQFRVAAVAHKTCDLAGKTSKGRRLHQTVHLEGLRCDGAAHAGCQAECNLFWRDEWLRPAEGDADPVKRGTGECTDARIRELVCSKKDNGELLYVCQATQMFVATEPLEWWDLRQYLFDVITRNHGLGRVSRVVFLACLRWLVGNLPIGVRFVLPFHDAMHRRLTGRDCPSLHPGIADNEPTPTGRLHLRPGEIVRIRSQSEIERTVRRNGRNRGLTFDEQEMSPYCGKTVRVRKAVTTIIEESTGRVLHMKEPCIMLDGVVCNAEYASCRLNCPRAIPSFWRELWLERATDGPVSPLSIPLERS